MTANSSEVITLAMIAATPATIAAVSSLIVSLLNRRQGRRNEAGIREVHVLINSRMTELLAVSKSAAHSEGVEQERVDERERQAEGA